MNNWDRARSVTQNEFSRSGLGSDGFLHRPGALSAAGEALGSRSTASDKRTAGGFAAALSNGLPSYTNALVRLSDTIAPTRAEPWRFAHSRFRSLEAALRPNQNHLVDAGTKIAGIARSLNKRFYGTAHDCNTQLVGSWGKGTVISPANDADIIYLLPTDLFARYDAYESNGQSALLQLVKRPLADRHARTKIKGDRQVVALEFNSLMIEVVPGFVAEGGGVIICDAAEGGSWKVVDSLAERQRIEEADRKYNGLLKPTAMMLKQWKRNCNVPIKSFMLERLAEEALSTMPALWLEHRCFDWIIREALSYTCRRADGVFLMAGRDDEIIRLGSDWRPKAESAHRRSVRACENEKVGDNRAAGDDWQKIFGMAIPLLAM